MSNGEKFRIEREQAHQLSRMADHVCGLILTSDLPRIDVDIAAQEVRDECERFFPEKVRLFEMIYESRFQRLWEQFREGLEE